MSNDPPDDIDLEEQADAVADFVEELLGQMDIDAIAEPAQQGERVLCRHPRRADRRTWLC